MRPSVRRLASDPFNAYISRAPAAPAATGGALAGLTYSLKDNISEGATTCASNILRQYRSPYAATVASQLAASGACFVGKNNMDEFGMGSANTNSAFGPALSPLFGTDDASARVAGGSSGGSAAAVAAATCDFSLGTDTGGSVRLPASYCGVVGFKPTYGRVSRWGVVAYAQSLDTVGVLARSVEVVERVFAVLDREDPRDPTSLPPAARPRAASPPDGRRLVFGVPQQFLVGELAPHVRATWLRALRRLLEGGHAVKAVSVPSTARSLLAYYTIATAEAASNLARFDGLRYGTRTDAPARSTGGLIAANRMHGLGAEVRKRILLGNYILSSDSGSHYHQATAVRRTLIDEFNRVFRRVNSLTPAVAGNPDGCDYLVTPTSIGDTPTLHDYAERDRQNFLSSYANDVLTVPVSLAGLPAVSVPCDGGSTAVGIQVIGQHGDDHGVLAAAKWLA
ncbi:Glutamyl-tRNA(Gln) amidotransferase subunit A, mitochondrial [[Candida] zeylanoides]